MSKIKISRGAQTLRIETNVSILFLIISTPQQHFSRAYAKQAVPTELSLLRIFLYKWIISNIVPKTAFKWVSAVICGRIWEFVNTYYIHVLADQPTNSVTRLAFHPTLSKCIYRGLKYSLAINVVI